MTALLVGIVMAASMVLTGCNGGTKTVNKEDAVALVNDGMVSKEDFNAYINFQKKGAEASGQIAPDMWSQDSGRGKSLEDELKEGTLDFMVTQEIILQSADKEGIKVDSKKVDEEFKKIKDGFGSEDGYNEYLTKMGVTTDYLKKLIEQRVIVTEYLDKVITIPEADVKKYYDENKEAVDAIRASHILVTPEKDAKGNVSADADKKAKEKAESLLKKVNAGENFETLAKENSDCPSAAQGGDLGYFGKNQMVEEFSKVAFALEVGQVSGLVKTEFGYHIIKLTDKKMDLASNKKDIEDTLKGQKFNDKIEELKKTAKIEKLLVFETKPEATKENATTEAGTKVEEKK